MAKNTSKMYVSRSRAKKYANKVGMMHDESKSQHIGKAPSLHLFHTTVRQCMAQSQDSGNAQRNLEIAQMLRLCGT